jgi:hypothetical protein
MPAEAIDMGAMGRYQLFAAGGAPIGGMMTKPAAVPMPFWTYYFQVDGAGAALERLKAGGGTVINGPMQVPGGSWIVQGLDPLGGNPLPRARISAAARQRWAAYRAAKTPAERPDWHHTSPRVAGSAMSPAAP